MQKWEYLKLVDPDAAEMNAWGEDGWELVAVITPHLDDIPYVFYFKRPKAEKPPTLPPIRK